jgi:hypothetical protein
MGLLKIKSSLEPFFERLGKAKACYEIALKMHADKIRY